MKEKPLPFQQAIRKERLSTVDIHFKVALYRYTGRTMNKFLISTVGTVFFSLILGVVFYAGYDYRENEFTEYFGQFKPLRKSLPEFSLINPLVGIDSPNAFGINLFTETENRLRNLIDMKRETGLLDVGVYYRDLNSSIWFGIDEGKEFIPASLLKMTYALAAYKKGEADPSFLDRRFAYTEEIAAETRQRDNADTTTVLEIGKLYSTQELIRIMLEMSDNGARDILDRVIEQRYLDEVFMYLGIYAPSAANNFEISTADYALFFRMLYSSTFINEIHSEEMLSMLTTTDFPYGITQLLPSKIPVAHKWGVFNFPANEQNVILHEFHDCGIVYEPEKPYLLCVMTKGTNQDVLLQFIAESSRIIYEDTILGGR